MDLIIDGHLDLAWNALSYDRDQTLAVHTLRERERAMPGAGRGRCTVSLPELRRAGVAVCFVTLLARARSEQAPTRTPDRTNVDYPSQSQAHATAHGQLAYYRLLEAQGQLRIIRTRGDLDALWDRWRTPAAGSPSPPVGVVLTMEGADPIVEPDQAAAWWANGLRGLSLAHFGPSAYAFGTPGMDGSGSEIGLTARGRELLIRMHEHGLMLDLTHISDAGFFDAVDRFEGVLYASHTNCRSLVAGPRQFSDEQIRLIVERDGVIGTVLEASMLHPGWLPGEHGGSVVKLNTLVDHIDHICQLAGDARHVAIGSDLDGGFGADHCPSDVDTIADLKALASLLRDRGFSTDDTANILHGNWLGLLRRGLPDAEAQKTSATVGPNVTT